MKKKLNKMRMWAVRIITALVITMELLLATMFDGITANGVVVMLLGLAWLCLILWANPQLTEIK